MVPTPEEQRLALDEQEAASGVPRVAVVCEDCKRGAWHAHDWREHVAPVTTAPPKREPQ